ncbi:MAG: hypothetical protein U0401_06780 [Anaerolineae bacterium]
MKPDRRQLTADCRAVLDIGDSGFGALGFISTRHNHDDALSFRVQSFIQGIIFAVKVLRLVGVNFPQKSEDDVFFWLFFAFHLLQIQSPADPGRAWFLTGPRVS